MTRMARWIAGAALAALSPLATAQAFPDKPVRLVVTFPPGASVDFVGRVVAQKLSESWGQPVVVENRAGANASIGSRYVSQAAPDGYTLLVNASIFLYTPLLASVPYDPLIDFTPIGMVARGGLILSVSTKLPIKDIAELVGYGRANPGRLNFGVGSVGSAGHLAQELFRVRAGLTWTTVPYKGSAPAYADLMAGALDALTDPAAGSMPHVKAGRIRGIAVTSAQRIASLPDVPTLAEQGYPGFEFYGWWGLYGPPRMPPEITARINAALNEATRQRDVIERLGVQGVEPVHWSAEQFARFQVDDLALAKRIVRDSNIRAE